MTRRRILCRTFMLVLIVAAVYGMSVGMGAASYVNLELTGHYDTTDAEDIMVSGNHAFIIDRYDGLIIVDISNHAAPTIAGQYNPESEAYAGTIIDNYVYIVGSEGIFIIDVSNPESPSLIGTNMGSGVDITVSENYAYVANIDIGVNVIDISDPTSLGYVGNYPTGFALDVTILDNYMYVGDFNNGILVLDVTDPAAPTLAGSYNTAGAVDGVAASGNYAYVADGNNGLLVLDISTHASPILIGHYNTAGYARHVAISGNYAYIADSSNGLVVVDISSPTAPTLAGRYNTAGLAFGVAVLGNYVYIADDSNGLVILHTDVPSSDITAPTLVITSPISDTTVTTSSIIATGTVSDDTAIASVTVNGIPATGTTSWSADITLAEGANIITVVATDTSGNTATETIILTYAPTVTDITSPTLTITSPTNGQIFTSNTITLSGIASDDTGLSNVQVKVGSGSWMAASLSGTSWSKSVSLVSGSNTIYVRVTDTSGNTIETSVTVTYTPSGAGGTTALSNSGGGSWQYQKNINIQENSGNTLTDYQILLELNGTDFPTGANINGADIRFTDSSDSELSYWIEEWDDGGQTARIWVKIPTVLAGTSTTIKIWYGNPSAVGSSNGDATFVFFDDFEGTSLDLGKWQQGAFGNGGIDVLSYSDSVLTYRGSGCGGNIQDWRYLRSVDTWNGSNIALRTKTKRYNGINYAGFGYGGTVGVDAKMIDVYFSPVYGENRMDTVLSASNMGSSSPANYFYDMASETWYIVDLMRDNNIANARINDFDGNTLNTTSTDVSETGNAFLFLNGVYNCITVRYDYDWILVRNYASEEPIITIGTSSSNSLSNSGSGSWQYQKNINIQENSGSTLTDYHILLELNGTDFPTGANTNGTDIRFTDSSDSELSYWIEEWDDGGQTARIWVKVPTLLARTSTSIKMWSGNPSAVSSSNGDATFVFFDNFDETSLNVSKWITPNFGMQPIKSVVISDSVLSFTGNGCGGSCSDGVSLRMNQNFGYNEKVVVDTKFRFTGSSWGSGAGIWAENSFAPVNLTSASCNFIVPKFVGLRGNNFYNNIWNMDYVDWSENNGSQIATLTMNGPWYKSSLAKKNETAFNGTLYDSNSAILGSKEYNVDFGNVDLTWVTSAVYSCGSRRYYYDWVFVRNYASTEPTITFGEENSANETTQVIVNGNFESDLSGWVFEDGSASSSCSSPYGNALWNNGIVELRAHSAYGNAYLSQNFSDIEPTYFKFDYNTVGGCGGITVYLMNENEIVYSYTAHRDSSVSSYSREKSQFLGQIEIYCSALGCIESTGTVEVYFNRSSVDVYLNDALLGSYAVNSSMDLNINSVKLASRNSCCDGRYDNYGYFDNITLIGTSVVENTTQSNLIFQDDFESYTSGSYPTGWNNMFSGYSSTTAIEQSSSGSNSFKLMAYSNWARIDYVIPWSTLPDTVRYEADIYIPDATRGGSIGFPKMAESNQGPIYNAVNFGNDGKIRFRGIVVGDYLPSTWYSVITEINFITQKANVYIDGILVGSDLDADGKTVLWGTRYLELNEFGFGVNNFAGNGYGTVYFDDVKIYSVGSRTDLIPPTTTIVSHTDGTIVTSPAITISGIASDDDAIASITVNGILATGTTNWSVGVTLSEGANTITAVATDTSGTTATDTITVTYTPAAVTLTGDVNGDGILSSVDALMALQMSAGNIAEDLAADVSGDGSVTSLDALMILQASVGAIVL